MNKSELSAAIAEQTGLPLEDAEAAVKAFVDIVTEELKKGSKVQILGFGTFEGVDSPAHEGRNPATGETIEIKAKKVPKFKAGRGLRDALKE